MVWYVQDTMKLQIGCEDYVAGTYMLLIWIAAVHKWSQNISLTTWQELADLVQVLYHN